MSRTKAIVIYFVFSMSFNSLCQCMSIHSHQPFTWWDILAGNFGFDPSPQIPQGPPPFYESARMARYIVHQANTTAMARISYDDPWKLYPRSSLLITSDGESAMRSTGVPILYLSKLAVTLHDLELDNHASLTLQAMPRSEDCTGTVGKYGGLPNRSGSSKCAQVVLLGTLSALQEGTSESRRAMAGLLNKHPAIRSWPEEYGWYLAKLNIDKVTLLDYYGEPTLVDVKEYLSTTPY